MKYIALFILLSGCCRDELKNENQVLREEVKFLTKLVKDQEDEIEYLGHQLMDCKNK